MNDDRIIRRKDGRELVFDHPVRPEDHIEMYTGPIPDDAIACSMRREPEGEAWMWDV